MIGFTIHYILVELVLRKLGGEQTMDRVDHLFETIRSGGSSYIYQMIADRTEETLVLDCKRAAKDRGPLVDSDKKNLAKLAGAFANCDGGVIIWGVDCSNKNSDSLDVMNFAHPIADLAQFKQSLDACTSQNLEPYPEGLTNIALEEKVGSNKGFAITYVPKWDGLPVRSFVKGGSADYFIRAGQSVEQMPSSLLADRFGRRPQPKLRLAINARFEHSVLTLNFLIENYGRGIAKNLSAWLDVDFNKSNMPQKSNGGVFNQVSIMPLSADNPYYRGEFRQAYDSLTLPPDSAVQCSWMSWNITEVLSKNLELTIDTQLHCDGFSTNKTSQVIRLSELKVGSTQRFESHNTR